MTLIIVRTFALTAQHDREGSVNRLPGINLTYSSFGCSNAIHYSAKTIFLSSMRYKDFEIANFKGIKQARVEFEPNPGANIFTLVGLNESGKTTLLEAIHSFSPDKDNQVIFSDLSFVKTDKAALIPKHRLSSFSDRITVKATVILDADDIALPPRKHCSSGAIAMRSRCGAPAR